ncbi:TOBE domain-containing protein [Pseudomonas indica]|uniref:Molybdate transport system regulatory protein n=1 Tax=Pseudomonas indica TaxID=137658 RepID=A0A1G9I1H5_9PSED|nr:TOBE domain-containing protein [Pseudomonas indica]SDL18932.1 molybdate transport system regulatory protein [Pseudomonas indica]
MSTLSSLAQHVVRRPQRIALLQQIAEQGSITRAAKAAGLSYKAAWDAIDELNNLAGTPLVERSVGGRGGGGARLSADGQRLLALYQRLESLQAQVLQAAEDSADLDLLGRLMLRTSARNQLHGRVVAIEPHGRHDRIEIALNGALRIAALITRDSTERLELAVGARVFALIKAGWLHVLAPDEVGETDHNRLLGHIDTILPAEEGPSEVRIALPSGQTLCALAALDHLHHLHLVEGSPVQVQFSPEQVLLGTPL